MPRTTKRTAEERAPDGRRIYSLGDVAVFAHVPKAQAQYWLKNRVIVPDYEARRGGTGNYDGFSFRNLVEFSVARWLSEWVGANSKTIYQATTAIRGIDPNDWYSETPRMRSALDSLPRRKRPTKKQALKWLDQHMGAWGTKVGDHTNPERIQEFNRHAAASGLFSDRDPGYPEEFVKDTEQELQLWTQFRDPATRTKALVFLYCTQATASVAFSESEVQRFVAVGGAVSLVNLTKIFEQLEKVTGDHWNKREQQ